MYIADLHIHSAYSRATSRSGDVPNIDMWARRKGIGLVGTGDFTHPAWRAELFECLEPAEDGLYTIKPCRRLNDFRDFGITPRFVVSGEISCIYKQDGKVRKVHNLILLPSLDAADRLSLKLEEIGNIRSDGRPIIGISSRDLLAVTLGVCPEAVFIPAHIWTPHFSVFGAFSAFNSVEECFGDLAGQIRALETGLSSDPPMNRRVPMLDGYVMVSNSDAHSPKKLGRECNLIDAPMSFNSLKTALETGCGFGGTVEFFPEEGKYHLDGHRNCALRLTPDQTEKYGGICPVCGKKLTVGVCNRLEKLASRPIGYKPPRPVHFEYLMPLTEVIAASTGFSEASEKNARLYEKLLAELGAEFDILRSCSRGDLRRAGGERIAEGISRLRAGRVIKSAGYDGEYGKIGLFTGDEINSFDGQLSFLAPAAQPSSVYGPTEFPAVGRGINAARSGAAALCSGVNRADASVSARGRGITAAQLSAVESDARVTAVIAGPGTGKTFTLTERIAALVKSGVAPEEITAVTFTVKAADELRERLFARIGPAAEAINTGTFHSVCLNALANRVKLADRGFLLKTAASVIAEYGIDASPDKFLNNVSAVKNGAAPDRGGIAQAYSARLRQAGVADFDDLLTEAVAENVGGKRFTHVLVDEFQDVNAVQYALVLKWLEQGKSLFVIGDPDQAIYGFRGASEKCFDRLVSDCPDARTVTLGLNYRSTPEIVRCAAAVIAPSGGSRSVVAAVRPSGEKVCLFECPSDLAEGVMVAKEIARLAGGLDMNDRSSGARVHRGFNDIAVLSRTHRGLKTIAACLGRDGIPFVTAGRSAFLDSPAVCGTLAFFRAVTEDDAQSAAQAAEFLGGTARDNGNFLRAKALFKPLCGGRPRDILARWRDYVGISSPDYDALTEAAHYADLRSFLSAMLLGTETDIRREPDTVKGAAVLLSTLHGAKGLEFPVVFLCGLNDCFPPERSDADEERRLFYVGITRAAEKLTLSYVARPSAFLSDLPADVTRLKSCRPAVKQLSFL